MGMRMNVAVGYGLMLPPGVTGLLGNCDAMEDESLFDAFVEEAEACAKARDDVSEQITLACASGSLKGPPEGVVTCMLDVLDYDNEYGFDDRVLLYPVGFKHLWHRYGDTLDAFIYESQCPPGEFSLQSEWREKPGTLYPFVGLMRANPEKPQGVETYWESCYLDKPEHKYAIPTAPRHLWHLIKHLELAATDEEATRLFLSLRPTFMRWFS
jgi:hypothetical protein